VSSGSGSSPVPIQGTAFWEPLGVLVDFTTTRATSSYALLMAGPHLTREWGDQSCHIEPVFRLLPPLSWRSHVLRLFQRMPSLEEAVAGITAVVFTTLVFTAVVCIADAFTVERPYAVEWR